MLQTRTDVKALPCERCRIIRSFIMFVIMLVLLALVAGDKLAYLDFLDAKFFATMIMIVGGVGIHRQARLLEVFNQAMQRQTSGPAITLQPTLAEEKNGHKYILS